MERASESPGAEASPEHDDAETVPDDTVATAPTRVEGAGARVSEPLSTEIDSPLQALRHDEIARSRRLSAVGITVAAATVAWATVLESEHVWILIVAACTSMVANLLLLYLASAPHRYRPIPVAVSWELSCVAIVAGTFYAGVFSPGPVVMLLALYFVSLGNDRRLAMAVYLTFAVPMAGLSTAVIAGWLEDPGLVVAANLGTEAKAGMQILVQIVFIWTFVIARWSRRTMLDAVTELGRTARALAKREALLDEARQDLDRALEVGGSGRFTGQTLGSYRLGDLIGRGAFGEVYEATHRRSGEPAAVKLLRARVLGNPGVVQRFAREVRISAELEAPNVVRVLEVSDEADPLPYLAMERLHGQDLSRLLRTERQLEPARALELVRQVGAGLTAAARRGIVHRDIKPQNLFWASAAGGERRWKILDFGVSKLVAGEGTTTMGKLVGTPIYMAPEQARGEAVDARTDLYALAAVAYRALTGMPPFRGSDTPSILYKVVHEMPVRPSLLAEVPREVDDALLVGMAKRPADRFASADELAAVLEQAIAGALPERIRERALDLRRRHPWLSS